MRRRSPVVARKMRAVLRTPAGNDPDIHLTTEYEHPLITEVVWTTSRESLGTVLETEADHA